MLSMSKCENSLTLAALKLQKGLLSLVVCRLALYESPNSLLKRRNPEGFFGTHIWPCIIDGLFLDLPDIILER